MACLAPNKLADGTEVACRECKLCQLKAKNDWVGRNIAESKTSKFCYLITATYGRGRVGESLHERAVILTYSDCQKLLKLLRRHGYEVRFFITGEYGSERGRAHWNIILYSEKPLPAFSGWDQYGRWTKQARLEQRFNWVRTDEKGNPVYLQSGEPAYWWPYGFVHIGDVSVGNIQYACKYVLKDLDANGKQGAKGQSKDPPLGTKWFRQIAEKYVEQGLAPQTPAYRFPEARTKEGVIIDFWLKGRPLELYLDHFIAAWAERKPGQPRPPSELVDLYEEYGRVINDEPRMLERLNNPSGRMYAARGSSEQERVAAERARYERAEKNYENGLSKWYDDWIEGAKNEQERQARRTVAHAERGRAWYAFQHSWGRHWYEGHGWELCAGRKEPCDCCEPEQLHADPVRTGEATSPSGVERQQPDYGLGKVGRRNRGY